MDPRRMPVTADRFEPRNEKILLRRDPSLTHNGEIELAAPIVQMTCTVVASDSEKYGPGDRVFIPSYAGTDLQFSDDEDLYVLVSAIDIVGVLHDQEGPDGS